MPITSIQASQDAEAKRKAIDNEIIRLLTQRNELAPISRLPPELIANIVTIYLDLDSYPLDKRRNLAIVAQISRRIRDIVIDHSPFWTNIDLSAPQKWNELCVLRSRTASLYIHGKLTNSSTDPTNLLKGHEWRFKVLDLEEVNIMFEGPAPRLEKLILQYHSNCDLLTRILSLPSKNLHHTELEECTSPWTDGSLTLRSLTYLSIHFLPDKCRAHPQKVLTALGTMPNLQFLLLQETLISATTNEASAPLSDVHLPHLTQITIMDDNPLIISALIPHIHPHARTRFHFACQRTTSSNVGPFLDLITSIALRITTTTNRRIRKLALLPDSDPCFIGLQCADDPDRSVIAGLRRCFSAGEDKFIVHPKKLLEIAAVLPIDHIEELRVGIDHGDSPALLDMLSRMQHLKILHVHGEFEPFLLAMKSILPGCAASVFEQAKGKEKEGKAGEQNSTGRVGRGRERGRGKDRKAKPTIQDPHSCNECALFVYSPWANLQKLGFVCGRLEFHEVLSQFLVFRQQIGRQLAVLEFRSCWLIPRGKHDSYRCYVGTVDWWPPAAITLGVPDEELWELWE
ncbi:hypothetical protein AX16_002591 [Volvariella volvacea WC 439]|nr:hypothetical protein AX16_002591 [Volvariella volvacea WC 439]